MKKEKENTLNNIESINKLIEKLKSFIFSTGKYDDKNSENYEPRKLINFFLKILKKKMEYQKK